MAYIPPQYLSKEGGQWRPVSLLDICVFLYHVHRGENDPEIGFEDIHNTVGTLRRRLHRKIMVDPAIIESCLWACSMAQEQGKFQDLKGRSFDEFVKDVVGRKREMHPVYHTVEQKKEKR
jgi:hypothetical protein